MAYLRSFLSIYFCTSLHTISCEYTHSVVTRHEFGC